MAANPTETSQVDQLSRNELDALLDGATWYAKYHLNSLAARADDGSAAAVGRREHFRDLHAALWKLGVRLRRPEWLDAT